MRKVIATFALLTALGLPVAAQAQGTVRGAEQGAAEGGRAAGPLGAIVGGAVGAATGTVGGILGVDDRPRFREYAVRERRNPYRYQGDVRVGVALPQEGVNPPCRDARRIFCERSQGGYGVAPRGCAA
jgi:hypothetical protein